jgi:hypothetical protein
MKNFCGISADKYVYFLGTLCHGRHFVFTEGVLPIVRRALLMPCSPDV